MRMYLISICFLIVATGQPAQAGVFDIPHFVNPGEFAIGLEPEVSLAPGSGLGASVHYTHGLSDLMNAGALIGTSSTEKKFRVGAHLTWDFFPDIEGQPGIGLATRGIYYRLTDVGSLEWTVVPYIHKTFKASGDNLIEPFVAAPFGMAFSDGRYRATSQVAVGSMFKSAIPSLRYLLEFGIAVNNSQSYISGGVVYYH